ncbi:MAG: OmpH family outer membrane protein [Bacteroidales bacterium]|nr:OmpH family outer membrane protein [Bacteroidales bacterium]
MKQINNIVQVVLAVAVIVLFVLYFSGKKTVLSGSGSNDPGSIAELPIAYVQIDSLVSNLEMWKDLESQLKEKQSQFDSELSNKQTNLQNKYNDLNNKLQKVLITRADAETAASQLQAEQQTLVNLADNYRLQLSEQEQVANRQVLSEIMDYLKEFNKDKKYQYIMAHSFGSQILYADEAFDITNTIKEGLNAKYQANKK